MGNFESYIKFDIDEQQLQLNQEIKQYKMELHDVKEYVNQLRDEQFDFKDQILEEWEHKIQNMHSQLAELEAKVKITYIFN